MHASIDHRISAIATPQHGAITRRQLQAAGLSDAGIAYRLKIGRLHRVHRGVFVVGHRAMSNHTRWMAAVLAGGDGAVLDLHAAAQLHRIERPSWRYRRRSKVAVLSTKQRRSVAGIRFMRTRFLPRSHVTKVDGIPVVTISRLVVNLGDCETPTTICKLLDEAAYDEQLDLDAVRDVARRLRAGRRCYSTVFDGVQLYIDGERGTDSELEEEGIRFNHAFGVPDAACNVYVRTSAGRYRVNQCWRDRMVIQEINGGGHGRPTRRRKDLRRRRNFRKDGWKYLVLTAHDMRDPDARERAGRRLRRALGMPADRAALHDVGQDNMASHTADERPMVDVTA